MPFLAFWSLFILLLPFDFLQTTYIIPGWHTTVSSSHLQLNAIICVVLLLEAITYRKIKIDVNFRLFVTHFLLTLPGVLLLRAPLFFLSLPLPDFNIGEREIRFANIFIASSAALFIAGQILFGIYCIKTVRSRRTSL